MSNLEKFIQENRASFDKEVPSLKVWSNIEKQLHPTQQKSARHIPIRRLLSIAATVLALLTIGGVIGSYLTKNPVPVILANQEPALPEEYQEVENYYKTQYQQKVNQLANYEVDPEFDYELVQFDKIIEELKVELAKAPKGKEERIIAALIQNYQTKIEVLQRVLDRVQSVNPKSENSNNNEISL